MKPTGMFSILITRFMNKLSLGSDQIRQFVMEVDRIRLLLLKIVEGTRMHEAMIE